MIQLHCGNDAKELSFSVVSTLQDSPLVRSKYTLSGDHVLFEAQTQALLWDWRSNVITHYHPIPGRRSWHQYLLIPGGMVLYMTSTDLISGRQISFTMLEATPASSNPGPISSTASSEPFHSRTVFLPFELGAPQDFEFEDPFYSSQRSIIIPVSVEQASFKGLSAFIEVTHSVETPEPPLATVTTSALLLQSAPKIPDIGDTTNGHPPYTLSLLSERMMSLWGRDAWSSVWASLDRRAPLASYRIGVRSPYQTASRSDDFIIKLSPLHQSARLLAFSSQPGDEGVQIQGCNGFCPRSGTWMFQKHAMRSLPRPDSSSAVIIKYD